MENKESKNKKEIEIEQGKAMEAYLEREEENLTPEEEIQKKKSAGHLLNQREAARLREKELLDSQKQENKESEPNSEEQSEQDTEQREGPSLDQVRENFAKCKINAERWLKAKSKFKSEEQRQEDFLNQGGESAEEYQQAKQEYLELLKQKREESYQEASEEIKALSEEKGWSQEKTDKELEKKMKEIVKETVVYEADRLYDTKTSFLLEKKFLGEQRKKAAEICNQALEWYRKIPKKYKFMLAGGLLGAGLAGGALGGAAGGAMITGAFFAKLPLRALSTGAMTAGAERILKARQEKKAARKSVEKITEHRDYASVLSEKIKQNDNSLDKRLLELEGQASKRKRRRYLGAATAGLLVASGAIGKVMGMGLEQVEAITDQIDESPETDRIVQEKAEEMADQIDESPEADRVAKESFVETVESGDSVWKLAEDQLVKHYGEEFTQLDSASQDHLIDAVKDRIAENPGKFGLEDIDQLKPDQQIDFSEILNNKGEMNKIFEQTQDLTDQEKVNILSAKSKIALWAEEHPGEKLTSEKVAEVLNQQSETSAMDPDAFKNGEEAIKQAMEEQTEEVSKEELDVAGEEKVAAEIGQQAELETKISSIEDKFIKGIGFNQMEYGEIQQVKVGDLLTKLPSESEAWEMYRETPVTEIDLPHDGVYGPDEFGKQVKLAKYLRSFNPDKTAQNLSVQEFIRQSIEKTISK